MKKIHVYIVIILGVIILLFSGIIFYLNIFKFSSTSLQKKSKPKNIELSVPYISQFPNGNSTNPWANACEEASAVMIEYYYQNIQNPSEPEAIDKMQKIFEWENKSWGYNQDTTAEETKEFINAQTLFNAKIKTNPTINDIKNELQNNRPVIAFVNQFKFYNETPSDSKGASLHVFVITGFDDEAEEFIINEPARDKKRYSYQTLLNSLHDYNPETEEADGDSVVLFTNK